MTMPHLMNCDHLADGWCLDCVKKLHDSRVVLPDDDLPVSDEWLSWIGFVAGTMHGDMVLGPVVRGIATKNRPEPEEYWCVRSYPLPCFPKTRREVRVLLDVLGVDYAK